MEHEERRNKRNSLYVILAIIVAVGIWFFVDETGDNGGPRNVSVKITDIPIEYLHTETDLIENGFMLVRGEDSGTDETIDLTIEGARRNVVQLDRSKIRVTANLSTISYAGKQMVPYDITYVGLKLSSDALHIKENSISSATVNIRELNRKEVEVHCEVTGNVAEGYSAGKLSVSPSVLEVRGQAEDVAKISYALAELDIGIDARESITKHLEYEFFDEAGNIVNKDALQVNVDEIQATLPVFVTKELELTMDFIESPGVREKDMVWKLTPSSIVVSGDAKILNGIDEIVLDTFNLESVSTESVRYPYSIVLPEGCQNLSGVTQATLEIAYPTRTTVDIPVTQFRFESPPEGKEVQVLAEEVLVSVYGSEETVSALTSEDLVIVLDLSGYSASLGTYTVPAYLELNPGIDVGTKEQYEIQVSIRESE